MQKCVKYSKNNSQKKYFFFNKTQIKYEFLTLKHIKIHVLLKHSKFYFFFGERFLLYYEFFYKILLKNMNYTYAFTLKEGQKMKMENFWGTKSWRNFLEGLIWKVDIFIGTKNIFNHVLFVILNRHFNIFIYCISTINASCKRTV